MLTVKSRVVSAQMVIEENPIYDYAKHIVFPAHNNNWEVSMTNQEGVESIKTYTDLADLEADFKSGELHPKDLKTAVAKGINKLLQPVRDHFSNDPYARNLLETIKRWQEELKSK